MVGHSSTPLETGEPDSAVMPIGRPSPTHPCGLTARSAAEALRGWIEADDAAADAPTFAAGQRSHMQAPILAILRFATKPGLVKEAQQPSMQVPREDAQLELEEVIVDADTRPKAIKLEDFAHAMSSNKIKLMSYARGKQWTHYPWIEVRRGGGRGNKAAFVIQWNHLDPTNSDDEDSDNKQSSIGGSIGSKACEIEYNYTTAPKSRMGMFIFPGDGGDVASLSGWRWRTYRSATLVLGILVICGLIAAILLGLAAINSNATDWPQTMLTSMLMAALFGACFWNLVNNGFLVRLMQDKIAPAPDRWLHNDEYAQVELLRRAGNGRPQSARLLKYQSQCPCGGRITVVRGTGPLLGRLVGVCSDSPLEHVFSFDRGTRRGRPLLSPYRDRDWSFGETNDR